MADRKDSARAPDVPDVRAPSVPDRPPVAPNERSLGDLFAELTREVSALVRNEVALAKAEMREAIAQATSGAVLAAAGGFILYAGLLALIYAAILGLALATTMAPWLAAVIVGVVVLIVGFIVLQSGISKLRNVNPMPERTAESLKDDKDMVKEKLK